MNAAAPIKLDIDWRAKDKREEARRGYVDSNNTCYLCGRKAGSHWLAVDLRVCEAVTVAHAKEDDDTAFFPIGATCRKGIPKTHIITRAKLFKEEA